MSINQFERLIKGIGLVPFQNLQTKTIALVGLGGVGGHAAEAVVRSGIGKVILLDFDDIQESNLNRQLIATTKTIGFNKTLIMKERLLEINPELKIITLNEFYDESSTLFNYQFDFLIDAIDMLKSKIHLITMCLKKNIPFISVTGTAKKFDPTKLSITTIDKTSEDPICKILRKHFKNEKFMVVFSNEKTIKGNELFSTAFVPSTAGIIAASYAIKFLLKE